MMSNCAKVNIIFAGVCAAWALLVFTVFYDWKTADKVFMWFLPLFPALPAYIIGNLEAIDRDENNELYQDS